MLQAIEKKHVDQFQSGKDNMNGEETKFDKNVANLRKIVKMSSEWNRHRGAKRFRAEIIDKNRSSHNGAIKLQFQLTGLISYSKENKKKMKRVRGFAKFTKNFVTIIYYEKDVI